MNPIAEAVVNYDQMVIVERYEKVIEYLYPIAQTMPRKHGVARDMFLTSLLGLPQCIYDAGKTEELTKFLASWRGHAGWADTHNLFNHLEKYYDYY